ncbi:type IV pilus modification protein PilV [Ramlibacter sp. PS4R-6]|uniref:type IV pilus modification protein PilV n=1 Tax=Ramlibacter sp. PS4R-6 TaxID=3133438 RepID=UPI0030B0F50B
MKPRQRPPSSRAQAGATMIEVLVSLLILMFGLLGLVGVMIQSQRAQLESYQRVQALMLVQDMASRMATNKSVASCYVLASFIGTNATTVPAATTCVVTGVTAEQKDRMVLDLTEWRDQLLGSAEISGGSSVGAILGARGCITKDPSSNLYQVSVAWQGSAATLAPPAGVACATGQYGTDDGARRAVSVKVQLS